MSSESPILPNGTAFAKPSFIALSASPCCKLSRIGVSMWPGLIAFTRIRRSRSSLVQVRAKDRTAALVALYTLMPGKPLVVAIDALRMIDPSSFMNGSPFCTEKNSPFTLAPK